MHNSSPRRFQLKSLDHATPVSKIRNLIQNLDGELDRLCKQYSVTRVYNKMKRPVFKEIVINKPTIALPSLTREQWKGRNTKPNQIDSKVENKNRHNNNQSNQHYNSNSKLNHNHIKRIIQKKRNMSFRPIPNLPLVQNNLNTFYTGKQKLYAGSSSSNQKGNLAEHLNLSSLKNGTRFGNTSDGILASYDPASVIQVRTLSNIYRAKVIDAYRNRRIFMVFGNYITIRRELLRRGWIEKLVPGRYPKLQGLPEEVLLQHARRGNDYEAVVLSRIVHNFPAFFVWQGKGMRDLFSEARPIRNRVRRGRMLDFSTKVGLIGCAEQSRWYCQDGVCSMSHPRFYRLGCTFEERMSFIDDFRLTQCCSLVRYISAIVAQNPIEVLDEDNGTIQLRCLKFAVDQLKKQVKDWENPSLDTEQDSGATEEVAPEWDYFIAESTQILNKKAKFKTNVKELIEVLNIGKASLIKLEKLRPDFKWDGWHNLWILKPGYSSRGIGIIIKNAVDDILSWSTSHQNRRYIVQKYIERPYLIYKTKFDIRQYMVLAIGEKRLTIWLYRNCYLRFSSQDFSIEDLRESIHLTNNSVQKKYKNFTARDNRLPKNNMWSLEQFQAYLKLINAPENLWNERIYNGFKQNLISVVLASLEETDFTENSFEMYGCDFMLDEEFNPILIEINSTPDLSPSTEVTAQICPLALKDLIKVVVDLPNNARTSTGLFECIYDVNYRIRSDIDPTTGFLLEGKRCMLHNTGNLLKRMTGRRKNALDVSKVDNKQTKRKKISNAANTVPLKSAIKEALAIRYTMPK